MQNEKRRLSRQDRRAGLLQHARDMARRSFKTGIQHIHSLCLAYGEKGQKTRKGTQPKPGKWHGINWLEGRRAGTW